MRRPAVSVPPISSATMSIEGSSISSSAVLKNRGLPSASLRFALVDLRRPRHDYVQARLLSDEGTVFLKEAICAPANRAETYDADADHRFFAASAPLMPLTACLILCSFSMRANLM